MKLNYNEALSDQASSLASDWILLLQRPRIPVSFMVQQQPFTSIHPSIIHPSIHPLPYPLATTNPLSFFVDLPVWDISYKWNHVLCVLLCLLLSLSIMCSRFIYTVACVKASLLFMAESYSTVWMDPTVCICSLITCWWSFGWSLEIVLLCTCMHNAQVFGFICKSGIAGSCGDFKFDNLRNCQTVLQNGSTISHSH